MSVCGQAEEKKKQQQGPQHDEFICPFADGTAKVSGKDYEFRDTTHRREQNERSRQNQQMTLKPVPTSGRSKVTSSVVIKMNVEFNSTCRRKKHFPVPLQNIDVTRSTQTDLDVLQEKRIDDYWNVDSSRHLSDSWKGFPKFTLLKERPPKEFFRSGRRLTKIQATARPDHAGPEFWTKIGKAVQNREKKEWAREKSKLDNARRIWMTKKYKETVNMHGENWKDQGHQLCLAKGKLQIRTRYMAVQSNLVNPEGNEWNLLHLQITKTTLRAKLFLR